jgi:hypothetical protein
MRTTYCGITDTRSPFNLVPLVMPVGPDFLVLLVKQHTPASLSEARIELLNVFPSIRPSGCWLDVVSSNGIKFIKFAPWSLCTVIAGVGILCIGRVC